MKFNVTVADTWVYQVEAVDAEDAIEQFNTGEHEGKFVDYEVVDVKPAEE